MHTFISYIKSMHDPIGQIEPLLLCYKAVLVGYHGIRKLL